MNPSASDSPHSTLRRARNSAVGAVLPELGLARAGGASRRLVLLILGGTALFCVVVGVAILVLLGTEEKVARHGATSFASALVHNDPSTAPAGASDDIAGVRAYFGPVTSARVIGAHNHAVNTGNSADSRSYFVADLFLRTRRDPAVIELAFDNHSLSSDEITGVRELRPSDAPSLTAGDRGRLTAAFAARGGTPADDIALSAAPSSVVPAAAPAAAAAAHAVHTQAPPSSSSDPQLSTAAKQLRCVERAHGDVTKLQACA